MNILNIDEESIKKKSSEKLKSKDSKSISEILINYSNSSDFGKPFTFTQETYDQFLVITIKNVNDGKKILAFWLLQKKQTILGPL